MPKISLHNTLINKPLFMWAGGKRKMLKHYNPIFPTHISSYVEPFFGGGAVFSNLTFKSALINDINWELMDLYSWIKNDPHQLLDIAQYLEEQYLPMSKVDRKKYYYEIRQSYWDSDAHTIDTSGILLFLLKTCFNGIWQACAPSKGRFGTPCGLLNHDKPFIDKPLILEWSEKLQSVDIQVGSFSNIKVPDNSFVFCDPPYRESFADYNTPFNDAKQIELIEWARKASKKSTVWISNRDCNDGFWEHHASDAIIHRFPVTYTAGRRLHVVENGEKTFEAKKAVEVLLVFNTQA